MAGKEKKRRQIQSTRAVIVPDEYNATSTHPSHSHMLFLRAEPQQHIAVLLMLWPIKVKARFHSCLAVSCSYVFTKVRFSSSPCWHLSTASPQQSAVNSTMIRTWRIELSKVDRMCNLQEGGEADFECLSEEWKTIMFYDRYPVREKTELPAA